MKKLILTRVFRTTTNKDGNPLVTKGGKPYTRLAIKVEEHGDKWLSGFGSSSNAEWKEGDTVEVEVEQKGEYLNFSTPNAVSVTGEKLKDLTTRVSQIEKDIVDLKSMVTGINEVEVKKGTDEAVPDYPELEEDDLPFDK